MWTGEVVSEPDVAIEAAPDFVEPRHAPGQAVGRVGRRVVDQHRQLVIAGMERRGGVEDEPRVGAAMLAEMLAVDVDIGDARRAFKHEVKLLALRRRIDGHLPLVPALGQRVVGGPRLEVMRHRYRCPSRGLEAVGVDVRQRVRRARANKLPVRAVEQLHLPWRGRVGPHGTRQRKPHSQTKKQGRAKAKASVHKCINLNFGHAKFQSLAGDGHAGGGQPR